MRVKEWEALTFSQSKVSISMARLGMSIDDDEDNDNESDYSFEYYSDDEEVASIAEVRLVFAVFAS